MEQKGQTKLLTRPEKVTDLAYNKFYQNIVSGVWPVGKKIPNEFELCDTYGVSRVSVRSAIQKLNALGMVEIRRGDGTYIKPFSLQNYLEQAVPFIMQGETQEELTQFREALESAAVRLAIEYYDEKAIDRLEEYFHALNDAFLKHDIQEYVKSDLCFHRQLCIMSQNQIILTMWNTFAKPLADSIRFNVESVYQANPGIDPYHLQIVTAIREKDLPKALQSLHLALNDIS